MSCKKHLVNKAEFTWETLESGLDGLCENGVYTGVTKVTSDYLDFDVDFYTGKYDMDNALCSLEDYAISLGLNVYKVESGQSTSTQNWYRYTVK